MKMEMRKIENNPANAPGKPAAERRRIPMSLPVQKLSVPNIPGYHLHWMRGDAARIQQALQAGYEFVDWKEIHIEHVPLGGSTAAGGNSDLGSHVSIAGGGIGDDNQPVRMILMKLKEEWWKEDQEKAQARNDDVANALKGGALGRGEAADKNDGNVRYVGSRTKMPDMFTKKQAR